MSRKVTFVVERADRLDRALAAGASGVSRRQARALIGAGAVYVDGHRCRISGRSIAVGARVVAHLESSAPTESAPPGMPVLWRANGLLAIAKPPGLHVNETETTARASVVSAFQGAVFPVHRLDRDTSGVLLIAQTPGAAAAAAQLFEQRKVAKTYLAVTFGVPDTTRVDAAIGQDRRRPRAKAVRSDGKSACTEVRVLAEAEGLAGIEARPITGRTHQVRVHLAHASSPIAGDLLYGGPAASRFGNRVIRWPRVMLHASALSFEWEGEPVSVTAPLPSDFEGLNELGLPPTPQPT